ncbi:Putative ribonuclease H protein At1g65750 [Linum grandiflorum]
MLWRARNKHLFEQDTESYMEVAHRCEYWVTLITSSWKTSQLGQEVLSSTRQTQLIGWRPSDEGCFTLSTDGSLCSPTKLTAAGGLIRTDTGHFVKAFASNLWSCSITHAEMRAIVDGLQLAWTLGIRRIQVQSRSMAAISILAKDSELDHQHAALVLRFKELCNRQWEVIFLIFTVKLILLRIIWPILVILSRMGCICLILHIGVCPTGFITILLAFLCLVL